MEDQDGIEGDDDQTLLNMINEERRKIFTSTNNAPECFDTSMTPYSSHELSQLFQQCSLNMLPNLEEVCATVNFQSQDILTSLKQELTSLKEEFQREIEKKETVITEVERMTQSISTMEAVMSQQNATASVSSKNIDVIESNIRKRFDKEKAVLREVLKCLFPEDDDMRDMLASLVQMFLKEGPDTYLTLDGNGDLERAATLVKSNLIEFHPEDPLQIRMVDMF